MFRWGIITMMVLGALLPGCTEPRMESTVVFAEGSDSCHFYRIPAMALDKDGNIVAVVDRRYESLADLGYRSTSIDISTRRSTDGGQTWTDILTVQPGAAAYSTMVLLKNGDVGILYEDGSQSTDNGYDIVFTRIPRRLIRRSLPSC